MVSLKQFCSFLSVSFHRRSIITLHSPTTDHTTDICVTQNISSIRVTLTFFEPCIVINLRNKNQQNAQFFSLMISFKLCLRHVSNNYVFFISVINQLDAQNFCFTISLFHASTCFEHMCSSSGGQNCITQPLVSSHL
jgi:hypothetical protein